MSVAAVRGQRAGGGLLETLDHGCFARAVVPDNERQRRIEVQNDFVFRTETSDALNEHALDCAHRASVALNAPTIHMQPFSYEQMHIQPL